MIVELDDWELDIEIAGPVKRLVRAGADAYLLADSLDELAAKIAPSVRDAREGPVALGAASTVDDLIASFLRESVEYSVRVT